MIDDAQNIFRESALLQLTATFWPIDKKLPGFYLQQLGNAEYLRGRKLLLDPNMTIPLKQVIGKARNYLRLTGLPFPIRGCVLVPKTLITTIQDKLTEFQWHYNSAVDDFVNWYPQAITDAKTSLGELFDELDYPTVEAIKKRFRFEWRYITVGPSNSRILPASLYKEEVNKFKELMEQARLEAIDALRNEFSGLVKNLTDKLSGSDDGKPKRLRDAAVGNLQLFLDTFSKRNLFADEELDALVNQCKQIVAGVNPQTIRTRSDIKNVLHGQMTELVAAIDAQLTDLPRRKIRLAA